MYQHKRAAYQLAKAAKTVIAKAIDNFHAKAAPSLDFHEPPGIDAQHKHQERLRQEEGSECHYSVYSFSKYGQKQENL